MGKSDSLALQSSRFFASVRGFANSQSVFSRVLWNWSDPTRITITVIVGASYTIVLSLLKTEEYALWSSSAVWLILLLNMPSLLHCLSMISVDEDALQEKLYGRQRPLIAVLSTIVLYAGVYAVLNTNGVQEHDWGVPLKHPRGTVAAMVEALYLSVTVLTTTGFGDVTPTGIQGYIVVMLHQLVSWVHVLVLLGNVMAALTPVIDSVALDNIKVRHQGDEYRLEEAVMRAMRQRNNARTSQPSLRTAFVHGKSVKT